MIVLVTGASAGFGSAIARRFASAGASVILAARRRDRLDALGEELGASAYIVELDVRDRVSVQNAIASLPPHWSEIDLLVNNAGLALGLAPAQRASLDDWETMVDTNVKGLMSVTHAVLPGMVARGRGHIINIGSTAGEWPYAGGNVYGATKAFVRQFSLNLRADLAGTPLRVSNVEPGLCGGTEFSKVRFNGDDESAAKLYENATPLTAEDVAETVHWIASRPAHMNVNTISLMPVSQSFAGLSVHRRGSS
ncbi:MAG: bifunctional NADP-dependent 3-hydroxy acid dehydrogenase/3-hydroxypropionate dehydrogenase YdfG [Hydrocarboniphaga sp.]|uniref:bifunctional NADP-dependent 3-hydroxy acid dehydrogenase/3-hydroxypropionate dehydrogenase YdfG n=1 Tax=Hydrocarboniphaga sp. TaxID=2033016 RepID=UPI00262BC3E9|nr:bifunctional NADP-dependent 3-hydroxy acid dehydrogenase/3-hydroxypropionate dehydrogenase YdfG [Hydrocarboniphaga sp.]MDB5972158.1 bifunctional NADP-dependent 3-hydroxy acid dehydrogenase/3-hydroxypropionate dehydrogenase YdfG [Hydrocarboniphaga sp.]